MLAAAIGGGGLTLARRWDSEHLGLLVLVPLIVLAPVVTDGVTLLLIGFMLALSAASLPVQLGKDWIGMHGARMAVSTFPLLIALVGVNSTSRQVVWLAAACAIAAVLAIASALVLLPHSTHPVAMALFTAAGMLPVLAVSLAVDRVTAAVMAAVLAAVLLGARTASAIDSPAASHARRADLGGVVGGGALLIAVTVAFDGRVAGPVLLAMASSSPSRAATGGRAVVGHRIRRRRRRLLPRLRPAVHPGLRDRGEHVRPRCRH